MYYKKIIGVFALSVFLGGCSSGSSSSKDPIGGILPEPEPDPEQGVSWFQPSPMTTWDIQYTGEMSEKPVEVVFLDMFDTSPLRIANLQAKGKKVICYISAGSSEDWRPDSDQFQPEDLGNEMSWPGETWLNITSENVRAIMESRTQLAKDKNCDGVDYDNVDGYVNNTGFNFNREQQENYNRFLADTAHQKELSVGLKNVPKMVSSLEPYFDFAVSESCETYNECDDFQPFIENNKAVFHIQYEEIYKTDSLERDALCQRSTNRMFSTLILDSKLDGSYRDSCLSI